MSKFKIGDIVKFVAGHNTLSNSIVQDGDQGIVLEVIKNSQNEIFCTVQLETDKIIKISENFFKSIVNKRYSIEELKNGSILNILTSEIYEHIPFAIDITDSNCIIIRSKLDWELFLRNMN